MGFVSAVLKRTMDKFIPLIHPYFAVAEGEAHHRARYKTYPYLGLLLEQGPDADDEDVAITTAMIQRMTLNFKSGLQWSLLTSTPVERVAQAILASGRPLTLPAPPAPLPGEPGEPPRVLTVFNGSPRGKGGNTRLLLEQLLQGFESVAGHHHEVFYLNHVGDTTRFAQAFGTAEAVLLAFPLYTDAMPGLVKTFIETLEPFRGRPNNPPIGFLVQSGFPEAAHSRYVERYLRKLAARLGSRYLGAVVKGGCEGVRVMPEQMNRKLFAALQEAGKSLAQGGCFDPLLLRSLARPEHYPRWSAPLFWVFAHTKLANFYWDGQLRENGVYEQRFARPYEQEP
jgi:NAD(P)H-dependent FMN reductase